MNIKLIPLQEHEKETFIRNIQIAFKKAVVEQFGPFDEEIIPRDHVIRSFEAEGAEQLLLGHILYVLINACSALEGVVVLQYDLSIFCDTNINLECFDSSSKALLECAFNILHSFATSSAGCQKNNFIFLSKSSCRD